MQVRLKTGVYAGQIRDIRYAAAKAMIDNGTAERIDIPASPAPPAASPIEAPVRAPETKGKKGRKQ